LLQGGALDPATTARALDVIARNCRVQLELIDDLLDVSRIVTGRITLHTRPVDLSELVLRAVDGVRPAAMNKDVRIELACEPATPPVTGDPDRLQQAVWNLLTNAVKFTGPGGRIAIRVDPTASTVSVSVTDDGIGIDPDVLPHVFDRFRQADSSITRAHGGLGLGLAIVRHLVELHGGTVAAASDGRGRGATFTISLPSATRAPAQRAVAGMPGPELDDVPPALLQTVRALVVEDDADAGELVAEILRQAGATVITADSAPAARDIVARERLSVIVSDIAMPGEDGLELIRRTRALGDTELARTPAIALTAYARAGDRERALAAGYQAHLPKPVEPVELLRTVAAVVRRAA
jgi:CheY-like chemotaxis protein